MEKFTARVELHNPEDGDYRKLHEEMKKEGFTRVILNSNDKNDTKRYRLPPGEYNYVGEATKYDILEKAKNAASAISSSFEVLITKSSGRTWHNLTEI